METVGVEGFTSIPKDPKTLLLKVWADASQNSQTICGSLLGDWPRGCQRTAVIIDVLQEQEDVVTAGDLLEAEPVQHMSIQQEQQ